MGASVKNFFVNSGISGIPRIYREVSMQILSQIGLEASNYQKSCVKA
jgi:hypothetical protein